MKREIERKDGYKFKSEMDIGLHGGTVRESERGGKARFCYQK